MLFRRIARPLLAAVFIAGGVDALLNPKPKAEAAKPLLDQAQRRWPTAPSVDPLMVARADGAVKIGAGLMMTLGMAPRFAAALLAVDLIPTTVAGHPFWSGRNSDERQANQIHFLKNAGLFGGLLLAITDTGGKPSLAWRAKHAKRDAKKGVERASRDARKGVEKASRRARKKADRASRRARERAELAFR